MAGRLGKLYSEKMMDLTSNFLTRAERSMLRSEHRLERDGQKKDRLKFILLADQGWSEEQIAAVLLLEARTLKRYWQEYGTQGLRSLLTTK